MERINDFVRVGIVSQPTPHGRSYGTALWVIEQAGR